MSKLARALGLMLLGMGLGLILSSAARAEVCSNDEAEAVNDPNFCRALWEKIGLPESGDDLDATIVCHTRYSYCVIFFVADMLRSWCRSRDIAARF